MSDDRPRWGLFSSDAKKFSDVAKPRLLKDAEPELVAQLHAQLETIIANIDRNEDDFMELFGNDWRGVPERYLPTHQGSTVIDRHSPTGWLKLWRDRTRNRERIPPALRMAAGYETTGLEHKRQGLHLAAQVAFDRADEVIAEAKKKAATKHAGAKL
jgi:hypothetical protein